MGTWNDSGETEVQKNSKTVSKKASLLRRHSKEANKQFTANLNGKSKTTLTQNFVFGFGFTNTGADPNLGWSQILCQQDVGQIKSIIRETSIVIFSQQSTVQPVQPKGGRLDTRSLE